MKRVNIKCPDCGSQAYLRPATMIYGDHTEDPTAKVYVCARYPACDSYVAAHRATLRPMGTLANKALRQKRMEAHAAFNRLWEEGYMSKKEAYRWLQLQMGLPESEAHIAKFSELRCQQVIGLCRQFIRPCSQAA